MDRLTKNNYEDDLFELQKTKKVRVDEYTEISYKQHNYNEDLWKAVKEKEDLEEKLDIDLITIFKALTEGVYVLECDDEDNLYPCYKPPFFNRFLAERRIESGYKFNYYISIGADEDLLNIKDYGEVWALTEEELEYDK